MQSTRVIFHTCFFFLPDLFYSLEEILKKSTIMFRTQYNIDLQRMRGINHVILTLSTLINIEFSNHPGQPIVTLYVTDWFPISCHNTQASTMMLILSVVFFESVYFACLLFRRFFSFAYSKSCLTVFIHVGCKFIFCIAKE